MLTRSIIAATTAVALGGCASNLSSNANTPNQGANADTTRNPTLAEWAPTIQPNPLVDAAGMAILSAHEADPNFTRFVDNSFGFAVFPIVMTGDATGGEQPQFNGRGIVMRDGAFIGEVEADIISAPESNVFSQIVFFQDEPAFNAFINDGIVISANAPTFPLVPGVFSWARFNDGVAVFTSPSGINGTTPVTSGNQSLTFFTLD